MSFELETTKIEQNIRTLALQLGVKRPDSVNNLELLRYTPEFHDAFENFDEQCRELSLTKNNDVLTFQDAARLKAFIEKQGKTVQNCISNNLNTDEQIVKLLDLHESSLGTKFFKSDTFRSRWKQSLFRKFLYLLAYFTEVYVAQSLVSTTEIKIYGIVCTSAVIPEYFEKENVVINDDKNSQILNERIRVVYVLEAYDNLDIPLLMMYLNKQANSKFVSHVLVLPGESKTWKQFIKHSEMTIVGTKNKTAYGVLRTSSDQRYFSSVQLTSLLQENLLPGFSIGLQEGIDILGRRVITSQNQKAKVVTTSYPALPKLTVHSSQVNWTSTI
jgi:hypothetical protein